MGIRWGYYTISGREFYAYSISHAFHLARCNGAGRATLTFEGFRPQQPLAATA